MFVGCWLGLWDGGEPSIALSLFDFLLGQLGPVRSSELELRCRLFAHVAHLGGILFGTLYFKYGMRCWDWIRVKCCEWQGLEERLIPSEFQKHLVRLLLSERD